MQRGSYDLILMDCQMPRMDGYDATANIRASEASGMRVPIIAMTASVMKGDRERCLAAGMDDYISKPITSESLRAALSRAVGRQRGASAAPQHNEAATPPGGVLDKGAIDELRQLDDDSTLFRNLLATFYDQAPQQLDSIRTLAEQHQWPDVAALAHKLKGSAGTFGAVRLVAVCQALEHRINGGVPPSRLAADVDTLDAGLRSAIAQLRDEEQRV